MAPSIGLSSSGVFCPQSCLPKSVLVDLFDDHMT